MEIKVENEVIKCVPIVVNTTNMVLDDRYRIKVEVELDVDRVLTDHEKGQVSTHVLRILGK